MNRKILTALLLFFSSWLPVLLTVDMMAKKLAPPQAL
jgi:hypothetical protein